MIFIVSLLDCEILEGKNYTSFISAARGQHGWWHKGSKLPNRQKKGGEGEERGGKKEGKGEGRREDMTDKQTRVVEELAKPWHGGSVG